jgi:hypothetical protein
MTEEIIGSIKGVILPEFTSSVYNLVFTDRRIIGDKVSGSDLAFLAGGVIGMAVASSRGKKKAQEMILKENPEEILSKHKRNFSVEYSNIRYIKLKRKAIQVKLNKRQAIVGKSPMFTFQKKQYDEVESIINQVSIRNSQLEIK